MQMQLTSLDRWESMWAPYDVPTYTSVLAEVGADDCVLEIGAGDLRLSRQVAARARHVYALERNTALLACSDQHLPHNLQLIVGDARSIPFPADVTLAILLMRHCTHFALYFAKLHDTACRALLTNARWGMGVETINLRAPRYTFEEVEIGWFACRCGHRGFKAGPPHSLTEENVDLVWEVDSCPTCSGSI